MSERFTLEIALGNEAMRDEYDVARALRCVADSLERGGLSTTIGDANGNAVGRYSFSREEINA